MSNVGWGGGVCRAELLILLRNITHHSRKLLMEKGVW